MVDLFHDLALGVLAFFLAVVEKASCFACTKFKSNIFFWGHRHGSEAWIVPKLVGS